MTVSQCAVPSHEAHGDLPCECDDITTYYLDADGDGSGDPDSPVEACASANGYVSDSSDCDDGDPAVHPGAEEVCNGIDDDCDGLTDDEDSTVSGHNAYLPDSDGDGFGDDTAEPLMSCATTAPAGYASEGGDCLDTNAGVNPNGIEACNGLDDDCDGLTDDDDPSVEGQNAYFYDGDADAFGDSAAELLTCATEPPAGYASQGGDCDDRTAGVNPGAPEVCNSIDDNCDGVVDDGASSTPLYPDADGDGYGDSSARPIDGCGSGSTEGYSEAGGDCDDSNASVHPGAAEVCNGVDDDCDGSADAVVDLAGGLYHSLALCSDGSVLAFGAGSVGQLGDGTYTENQTTPVKVSGLDHVIGISAGMFHNLALRDDGTVLAWGYNADGELGDGSDAFNSAVPVQVVGLPGRAAAVSAGGFHSLALMEDGTVFAWGFGGMGELGSGDTPYYQNTPVQVAGLQGAIAIDAGGDHSLALLSDGTVMSWGYNADGELGDGTDVFFSASPVQVLGLSGVVAVEAGGSHSLVLLGDGTLKTWGANYYGELGPGASDTDYMLNVPIDVPGVAGVVDIGAGGQHSLAVLGDGTVLGWGYNYDGELGDGNMSTFQPDPVLMSDIQSAVKVSGGYMHSLTVRADGAAFSTGYNSNGQLGDGTTDLRTVPVRVNSGK